MSWLVSALDVAEEICYRVGVGGTFTVDEIWEKLIESGAELPNEPRHMQVLVTGLRKHGIIMSDGVTKCSRPERNSGYVTVWRVVAL